MTNGLEIDDNRKKRGNRKLGGKERKKRSKVSVATGSFVQLYKNSHHFKIKTLLQKNKDEKNSKLSIGLCFSAGSLPAAIVAGGLMRGFQQKKLGINGVDGPAIDKVKFTAAVSGGLFPSLMYSYAKNTTSEIILDADGISDPSKLSQEELENIPESSLFRRFIEPWTPYVLKAVVDNEYNTSELNIWENVVYHVMLEPLGIGVKDLASENQRKDAKPVPIVQASVLGPLEVFPEYSNNYMNQRFAQQTNLRINQLMNINSKDRLLHNQDLWKIANMSDFQIPLPAMITPTSFTIPTYPHVSKFEYNRTTNTTIPLHFRPVTINTETMQSLFTVSRMLAVGTDIVPMMDPPSIYEPLTVKNIPFENKPRDLVLADGGFNDELGIPSLVRHKVKNIICNYFLSAHDGGHDKSPFDVLLSPRVTLNTYFGLFTKNATVQNYVMQDVPTRHIFDLNSNNENQYEKLLNNLKSLHEAGEPMITTLHDLDVIENPFYGIKGGYKVNLTIIVTIGVPRKFSEQLAPEIIPPPEGLENLIDEFGYFTNSDLNLVPNLRSQNAGHEINLPEYGLRFDPFIPEASQPVKATKLTYLLMSWIIHHAWEGLRGADGQLRFEGFGKIFG